MNGLLKLLPDVPVEIALSSTDGINVVSPRGTPAVRYTLVDGRTFFATQYVAAKFKKLKVEPCERIALCMRNIDGKSITQVERVPEPQQDPSTKPTVSNDAVDPPASDPRHQSPLQEDLGSTPSACDGTSQGDEAGNPNPELPSELPVATANGCESPAPPISQLERALKIAILASHSAEQYGKEIGYPVRFDHESVKCMAVTVLIGMQGGRN
jgi:hypothetical protein